jgi:hypothetical protein
MACSRAIGAAALAAALGVVSAGTQARDFDRYPDMRAQWTRIGSAQFDPDKPSRKQDVPFTPEYQAKFDKILADRAAGGLANNATASCLPAGMPRTMIVYETMETIVTPETTYIRISYMNELRRIYTDGRAWPQTIEPSFIGYSIGQWIDEDGDGRYDVLAVETRGFKGPRSFDGTPGTPMHEDNQTIIKERIYLDKANDQILHDDITVIDHALTRPWTVHRKYRRAREPFWSEFICEEGNQQVIIGDENYMISADGDLMPTKKDQPPPDLRFFNQTSPR